MTVLGKLVLMTMAMLPSLSEDNAGDSADTKPIPSSETMITIKQDDLWKAYTSCKTSHEFSQQDDLTKEMIVELCTDEAVIKVQKQRNLAAGNNT